MKLISEVSELKKQCDRVFETTGEEYLRFNTLVNAITRMHQTHRVSKNFAISDELRDILKSVKITIVQGTDGYKYDKIPESLRGRPVGDTWRLE